jgi:hypothetical protein
VAENLHVERIKHKTNLCIVKCEPFGQMYDLWIDVDIVEDIRDEATPLAELGLIVEEITTLVQRKTEVANDLR